MPRALPEDEAEDEAFVPLWDGQQYPRRWLDEHYPGLSEYALNHRALEESLPVCRTRIRRCVLIQGGAGMALTDALILWAYLHYGGHVTATDIGIIVVWNAAWLAFVLCGFIVSSCLGPLQLRVADGKVLGVPLRWCLWRRGQMGWIGRGRWLRSTNGGLVLIVGFLPLSTLIPRAVRWIVSREIPCGFDLEAAYRWESFFQLAGIQELIVRK